MERTEGNLRVCRDQIRRFQATDSYPTDQERLMELMYTLCDIAKSPEEAAAIATARLLDASLTRHGDTRGSICPKPADLIATAESWRSEQRAKVPWKPDPPPMDNTPWTPAQRAEHDEKWARFLADPANAKLVAGAPSKKGLVRAGALLDRALPMTPNPRAVRAITEADIAAARTKKNG